MRRLRLPEAAWAAVPQLVALAFGVARWQSARSTPLSPDAQQFLSLAQNGTIFGSYREPVWVALLMVVENVLGPTADAARVLGVIGLVLLVTVFQIVAWRLYGRVAGTLLALVLAATPWLAYQASRGAREETAAAGLLLLGLAATNQGWFARYAPLTSIGAGVLALLRWDTLLLSVVLLAVAYARARLGWRTCILGASLLAVVVAPLLIVNGLVLGDPLAHTNEHSTYYAYLEFGWTRTPASPILTWGTYIFGMHTLPETAWRLVEGTLIAPTQVLHAAMGYSHNMWFSVPLVLVAWIGGLRMLREKAWPFGLLLFLASGEFAFIADLLDERLALSVLPLALLGLAAAARAAAPIVVQRMAARGGSRSGVQPCAASSES